MPVQAPTLSEHLLSEAAKFLFYPRRVYRTRQNLAVQAGFEQMGRKLVEWRKTFARLPKKSIAEVSDILTSPMMLDELFSKDLLREVPKIVERTRALSELTLLGLPKTESFVYLREAANCYLFGLPQAAVSLARAAVEISLKQAASKQFGERVVAGAGLFKILDDYAVRGRLLSKDGLGRAHKVRIAGDKVLHDEPMNVDDVLAIIEAARAVVLELQHQSEPA